MVRSDILRRCNLNRGAARTLGMLRWAYFAARAPEHAADAVAV